MLTLPDQPHDLDALRRWMAAPEAAIFLDVLRTQRRQTLENLTRMTEEVPMRMQQGQAQILAEVIKFFSRAP